MISLYMSNRSLITDNDISGGSFGIRQVKLTLNGAFNILQEKLCLRAKDMTTDEDWYKAAEDDPEELSLLSAVMGVTREVSISLPRSSLS
jgi:non-canonical poly(A) RNA polymerase PAPD5/7